MAWRHWGRVGCPVSGEGRPWADFLQELSSTGATTAQGSTGAMETEPMQVGWWDSTSFLMHFPTQPSFPRHLPLLPLLHMPLAKPRCSPPSLRSQTSPLETMPPHSFTSKSSIQKLYLCIPVLPWTRNSSSGVQICFLQLGTPAPTK